MVKSVGNKEKYHLDRGFFDSPSRQGHLYLCQLGDLYCGNNYHIQRHVQSVYEITFICSGKGTFFIDGRGFEVKRGDIILNKPGQVHEGLADSIDPFRYFYIGFLFCDEGDDEDCIYRRIKDIFDTASYPVTQDMYNIESAFLRMYREIVEPDEYSNPLIKNYMSEIVLLTSKHYKDSIKTAGEYEIRQELIDEIINYIDLNSDRLIKISDISSHLGYSSSYISHVFSRKMGMSIKDYCENLRLEKALKLLKESNKTISEIAEKLSYSSVHSFSKAVKAKFGASPSYFKNKSKNMEDSKNLLQFKGNKS